MRTFFLLISILTACIVDGEGQTRANSTSAQVPIQVASSPSQPAPTLMNQLKRATWLIESDCALLDDAGQPKLDNHGNPLVSTYTATAFLVSMPEPRITQGSFSYLVTNRHVAQPGVESGAACKVIKSFLRMELKSPDLTGSFAQMIELSNGPAPWVFPADMATDLAVLPFGMDFSKVDVVALPTSVILSDADVAKDQIEAGDSVLFTGLFVQLPGRKHAESIIREGKVALMPREQVTTTLGLPGDVYLVDCHVFGGNSGSPMFVNLAGQRYNGLKPGMDLHLLGIVSGYMVEDSRVDLQPVASYAGTFAANSGVTMVVPAQKLLDLLDSPPLRAQRDSDYNEFIRQSGTQPRSKSPYR